MDDQTKTSVLWERAGERNDLICWIPCKCGHMHHIMGYCDAFFFDTANAKPRAVGFECGRIVNQQWFRNGSVEITEVSKTE